jgi:hypothetical protein
VRLISINARQWFHASNQPLCWLAQSMYNPGSKNGIQCCPDVGFGRCVFMHGGT